MNSTRCWLHIGRSCITYSLPIFQSHNFVITSVFVLASYNSIGVVRSDAIIRSVCLHDMCDGIKVWNQWCHRCLLMSSVRRDLVSSCCTKVLCAEHLFFEDNFVPDHFTPFQIINLVLDKRNFLMHILLLFLVYISTGSCTPNPGAKSCRPKENIFVLHLCSTGSLLDSIIWVVFCWSLDPDFCHPTSRFGCPFVSVKEPRHFECIICCDRVCFVDSPSCVHNIPKDLTGFV